MVTDEGTPAAPEAGPDEKATAATDATTTEPAALGLALSGGGVRAALFSLGVVIGLIATGCHRRVRCITSVSGGSILNAALAHGDRLTGLSDTTKFEPLASKLAASLASAGCLCLQSAYCRFSSVVPRSCRYKDVGPTGTTRAVSVGEAHRRLA